MTSLKRNRSPRPFLRATEPEETDRPEAVNAIIPAPTKAAVDALTRIHLGTGTLEDLAEIALAVHEGKTRWRETWFLEAVMTAVRELQERVTDVVQHSRWNRAGELKTRQTALVERLRPILGHFESKLRAPSRLGEPD